MEVGYSESAESMSNVVLFLFLCLWYVFGGIRVIDRCGDFMLSHNRYCLFRLN